MDRPVPFIQVIPSPRAACVAGTRILLALLESNPQGWPNLVEGCLFVCWLRQKRPFVPLWCGVVWCGVAAGVEGRPDDRLALTGSGKAGGPLGAMGPSEPLGD